MLFAIGVVGVLRAPQRHRHLHGDRADAERRQPDASSRSRASSASIDGQVIVFFVMTVAAAEAAVGLAIIIAVFRNRETVNADELTTLRG